MTIYEYGNPEAEVVLIQPVGDHDLPEIEAWLERIELRKIIIDPTNRRRNKIGLNEDSFYYLCFACSFKAYSQNNEELLNRLHEKVLEKED